MSLVFLTQVLPYPLDAGPKVRAYYTLRHLAAHHSITLLSFVRESDSPEAVAHLEQFCERVIPVPMRRSRFRDGIAFGHGLVEGEPFLIARDRAAGMYAVLRELMAHKQFETVQADQLWMAPYALVARMEAKRRGYQPRLVLDQHNAVHLIPRRLALGTKNPFLRLWLTIEANRMARFEARICQQFDHIVWVTAQDRDALHAISRQQSTISNTVIPICLDPRAVTLAARHPDAPPSILFLGGMHWPPNADGVRWFAREVLPGIRSRIPEVRFFAVGRNPPLELRAPRIALNGAVVTPGYLNDPHEYWECSQVFVVPLRAGGGMRVKILDAWARGFPVVSTTIGAEGITYEDGENILIADTPQAFAEAVVSVLRDEALADRLSRGGRAAVEEHYDWRLVYRAWDEIYTSLAASGQSKSEVLQR